MQVRILCVGRIKEKFYTDACAEYLKRLTRYYKVSVEEVPDERTPDRCPEGEKRVILEREGERLLKKIGERDYVTALAIDGRTLDTLAFSRELEAHKMKGTQVLDFVIGGSLGLSPEVLERANCRLSFSAMTFPHQLMRVILLEQIYRAARILAGEPYHK